MARSCPPGWLVPQKRMVFNIEHSPHSILKKIKMNYFNFTINFFFILLISVILVTKTHGQNFLNPDLNGTTVVGLSTLPNNWQNVPFTDINCQATNHAFRDHRESWHVLLLFLLIGSRHISVWTLHPATCWCCKLLNPATCNTSSAASCWIQQLSCLRQCWCDAFYNIVMQWGLRALV